MVSDDMYVALSYLYDIDYQARVCLLKITRENELNFYSEATSNMAEGIRKSKKSKLVKPILVFQTELKTLVKLQRTKTEKCNVHLG